MKLKIFHHFTFKERLMLKNLLEIDYVKRKNGKPNISEISKILHKSRYTIVREIKRLKNNNYDPKLADDDYWKKRKKCIKHIMFSDKELRWLDKRFNKYHDTPKQLIYRYFIEFGIKFPICVKTLYKYIYSGLLNLSKDNLYFHGKKFKTTKRKDNRGKISNFRTIDQAKHDKYEFGWFQMDTVIGKYHQSSCLVLTEELSKKTFCKKLKENSVAEVAKAIKKILNNKIFKNINIKGIITDQGKEFSKWKEIEKITGTNVYFCDAGTPNQKPLVERMNRDIRHWFAKGTDFNNITQQEIDWVINVINNKPRPCLQWLSSQQLFLNLSSHI